MPLTARRLSFPRRQQMRRLGRAAGAGGGAAAAAALAIAAAGYGQLIAAAALLITSVGLYFYARHWARLATRSGVGARSEAEVQRALAVLKREGWRLRSSLPWQGRGDIDHVAIAPTGFAFAIETKTTTYTPAHIASVRAQADWMRRRRRRWCPQGAHAVLSVTRGPQLEHVDDEVLVVSSGRLVEALRVAAGTTKRPGFLR
jgi:uncharacterized membrane protein